MTAGKPRSRLYDFFANFFLEPLRNLMKKCCHPACLHSAVARFTAVYEVPDVIGIPSSTDIPAAFGVHDVADEAVDPAVVGVLAAVAYVPPVVVVSAITGVLTFARNSSVEGVFIIAGIPVYLLLLASLLLLAPLLLI